MRSSLFCGNAGFRHHSKMREKKIHYVPGIISLIGLPVLLFFRGPSEPANQKVIRINLPAVANDSKYFEKFPIQMVYDAAKNKKMVTIDVDDVDWDERSAYLANAKYLFIKREIERLQFLNDTMSVLKISFGIETKYSSILGLINQTMIYDIKRYALVDDDLYIFANPRPSKIQFLNLDSPELPISSQAEKVPVWWQDLKTSISDKWEYVNIWWNYLFNNQRQNRLLAAGFLLLILLPAILKIRWYMKTAAIGYRRNVAGG